jgi:U2-associated protein SR140
MWPRTPEEKARNRHTGFVCFMNRQDAEDAMEACDETDPFRVGRRIMMRWGKNVKKVSNATMTPFATKRTSNDAKRPRFDNEGTTAFLQESLGGSDAIQVVIPKDPKRARFITTIASFVAKDGSLLEQRLIAQEFQNPNFSFLTYNESMNSQQKEDHLFYKWRVYAFCQGDGLQTWRMEPFQMFADNHRGRFWIPPPVNRAAAMQEEQASVEREQRIRQQKAQRRRGRRNEYLTGRQLEQARSYSGGSAADGSAQMTENELKDFRALTRDKLCASREAICNAMAYCFEKSGAAKQIANLLRELLVDNGPPGVSVDTRIARLYLLSDVLYNSQQPGVRNAFLYRDAIERMAPDVFASLGKHGNGKIGRMTFMKLKTAVSSILSAWTNWSVYNPTFIDELEARFDGREVAPSAKSANDTAAKSSSPPPNDTDHPDDAPVAETATVLKPRGDWKEVAVDDDKVLVRVQPKGVVTVLETMTDNQDDDSDVDGEPLDDDDLDGESLGDEDFVMDGTADGKTDQAQNKKPAGEESDELDGEPL